MSHGEQEQQYMILPHEHSSHRGGTKIPCKQLVKPIPLNVLPVGSTVVWVATSGNGSKFFFADFRKNAVNKFGFDTVNYFIVDTNRNRVLHRRVVDGSYQSKEFSQLYKYKPTGTDHTLQPQPNAAWLYEQPVRGE